jgi:mannose-6-phosphate isomerase
VDLLACTIMPYAWGSRTAIAAITNRPPAGAPEAELWMGAHPVAPSTVERGGIRKPLDAVVAEAPEAELGEGAVRAFGPRLPFLLKILAAAEPLSLQAHPTAEQARRGWDDEEARAVPRDAPHRNYKDASHKPELLCALTPFDALSGFRPADDIVALFDALAVPALEPALRPLRAARGPSGLAETFRTLMTLPRAEQQALVDATVARCAESDGAPAYARERALVGRLAALYPGDIGVVSSLLLELVHLEPGEAIYLGAGNLHAYLEGVGVEIMASSDNVLRGGLTKKHVDVPELLRVLDFGGAPVGVILPRPVDAAEAVYDTPASEFRLSRIALDRPVRRRPFGPEILFVLDGTVRAAPADGSAALTVPRGAAAFVPASSGEYVLERDAEAPATVFRATTNLAT